jgi:hypothetical protein
VGGELARYERARAEPRARTGTVAELVQLFIAEKINTRESSLQTRYRESNRLEHFVHTCGFGEKFVKNVADDDIEDWMEKRSRSVRASTAAKDLIAVRHLFKWCIATKSARTQFGLCLSRAAYDQARGKIDLAAKDLGEQRLKNIAEPVQVYSVSLNGNGSVSFGDGAQGKVPSASSNIVATYRRGAGIVGAVAVLVVIVVGGVVRH